MWRAVALTILLGGLGVATNADAAAATRRCAGAQEVKSGMVRIKTYEVTTSPGDNAAAYTCRTAKRVAAGLAKKRLTDFECTTKLFYDDGYGCGLKVGALPAFDCFRTAGGRHRFRIRCIGDKDRSVQFSMADRENTDY